MGLIAFGDHKGYVSLRCGAPQKASARTARLKAENELLHREIEQLRTELVTLTVKGTKGIQGINT